MGGFYLFEDEEYLVRYKKGQSKEYPHTITVTENDDSFNCVAILDMSNEEMQSFKDLLNQCTENGGEHE